jgi:anti-anti-sigma factor
MIGMPPTFEIIESQVDGWLRLTLVGELDLGTTPIVEKRIARLRDKQCAARIDLSKLAFIDSTGLHLLIRSIGEARANGWELQIEPELSAPVKRLFRLARLDRLIFNGDFEPPPARRGRSGPASPEPSAGPASPEPSAAAGGC